MFWSALELFAVHYLNEENLFLNLYRLIGSVNFKIPDDSFSQVKSTTALSAHNLGLNWKGVPCNIFQYL